MKKDKHFFVFFSTSVLSDTSFSGVSHKAFAKNHALSQCQININWIGIGNYERNRPFIHIRSGETLYMFQNSALTADI